MSRSPARTRRALALVASSVFAFAFAALFAAQLALMSFLDLGRAESAAREVASSAFVAQLVDDAVRNAVVPVVGPQLGREIATAASVDPRVRDVIRSGLVSAHRQVVDPAARGARGGAPPVRPGDVQLVLADVLVDLGDQVGADLSGLSQQLDVPDARPERLPDVGLRTIAVVTRLIGAVVAVVAGIACLVVHPRPALALSALGARAGIVCGAWGAGLLAVGWVIGLVASTMFGELLDAVWRSAAPAVLGLAAGGALASFGVWLGGRSIEGLVTTRRHV